MLHTYKLRNTNRIKNINKMRNTNKMHRIRLSKLNYKFGPHLTKMSKHGGGIIGAVKHWWHMKTFNNFLDKYTKSKENLRSEYESFKAESKFYMDAAKEKSKLVTDLLTAHKVSAIYELHDYRSLFDNDKILSKQITKHIAFSKGKIRELENKISRLDYDNKKNKNEFDRMNNKFNKTIDKFEAVMDDKVNIAEFLQKVKTLYEKYTHLKGIKKEKLSKKHQKILEEFELNKEHFKKVHSFTESYFDKTNKEYDSYMRLRRQAEYYNNEFNRTKIGNFSKNIKEWKDEIIQFNIVLLDCDKQGKEYAFKYKKMIVMLTNIGRRFSSTGDLKRKEIIRSCIHLIKNCKKYQDHINDLLIELKIHFFQNKPASRLQYHSNLIYRMIGAIYKWISEVNKHLTKL